MILLVEQFVFLLRPYIYSILDYNNPSKAVSSNLLDYRTPNLFRRFPGTSPQHLTKLKVGGVERVIVNFVYLTLRIAKIHIHVPEIST